MTRVFSSILIAFLFIAAATTTSIAEDRKIVVVNNTGKRITELYASPIDQKNWKFNMLQGRVIYAHDQMVADIDDGTGYCRYDLLAVLADGRKAINFDVNVCVVTTWTIEDAQPTSTIPKNQN